MTQPQESAGACRAFLWLPPGCGASPARLSQRGDALVERVNRTQVAAVLLEEAVTRELGS